MGAVEGGLVDIVQWGARSEGVNARATLAERKGEAGWRIGSMSYFDGAMSKIYDEHMNK